MFFYSAVASVGLSEKGRRQRKIMVKNIALVAHDNKKNVLVQWVKYNRGTLCRHNLVCTGTTGRLVEESFGESNMVEGQTPSVVKLKSGPLGGDQQLGAMIAEGKIDIVVFLWDPMEPQPHDVDVKALLRLAVLYNVPTACNRATADFLISSPLLESGYTPEQADFTSYTGRRLP